MRAPRQRMSRQLQIVNLNLADAPRQTYVATNFEEKKGKNKHQKKFE